MKSILRNFFFSLRRFRLASTLNILGLSAAFAAFMIIGLQVRYELSFNRVHANSERIFRVEGSNFDPTAQRLSGVHSRPFIDEFIASSPHIEAGSALGNSGLYYTVGEGAEEQGFQGGVTACYPDLVKIIDFDMVEGTASALQDPDKMLIPLSQARLLFGSDPAVGKTIYTKDKGWNIRYTSYTVGGVYRDFPGNTHLRNHLYYRFPPEETPAYSRNYQLLVLLDSPINAAGVIENFQKNYHHERYPKELRLTSLPEAYYVPVDHAGGISGSRTMTGILIGIALLVIGIAAINFTNFATSLAPMRIRSINTQKILGNPTSRIRMQLISESMGTSLIAFGVSLLWVWVFAGTQAASLLAATFEPSANGVVYGLGLGMALAIGLLAGIYPAYYTTSFQPALVLKGSFGLSPQGRKLRTALIGFQYVISAVLIVAALFIQLQNRYASHLELGFDKDNVALVGLNAKAIASSEEYANRLRQYAGIEDVAFASTRLYGADNNNVGRIEVDGKTLSFSMVTVSDNFREVMGIPLLEGRDFLPSDHPSDPDRPDKVGLIFNRYTQQDYQLPVGLTSQQQGITFEVIGIMEDFHLTSVRRPIGPVAFVVGAGNTPSQAYIKIRAGANLKDAVAYIDRVNSEMDPLYPFRVQFFDEVVDNLYRKETQLGSLVSWFCVLAVLISLMGVFGLVLFETQYRRKEIGVRRVFGATVREILEMFNRSYLRIVLICFVIAAPLAGWLVSLWLKGYAYKTPLSWWIYAVALSVLLAITAATVTFQSYRAATRNPAESLRAE